ncbi:MAG: DNA-protecting protein DprA, partial [Deltaproteobacteria bacterium]
MGNLIFKRLIDCFQTPAAVFSAARKKPELFQPVTGVSTRLVDAIARFRPTDGIKREIDHVLKAGFSLVTMTDHAYPPL